MSARLFGRVVEFVGRLVDTLCFCGAITMYVMIWLSLTGGFKA